MIISNDTVVKNEIETDKVQHQTSGMFNGIFLTGFRMFLMNTCV